MDTIAPPEPRLVDRPALEALGALPGGALGVVSPVGILVGAPGIRFVTATVPLTVNAAALLCLRLGLRQLWWHGSGHEPCGLPHSIDTGGGPQWNPTPHRFTDVHADWRLSTPGLAPWLSAWRGRDDYVEFGFPLWDPDGNPFAACATPADLLEELVAYREAGAPEWTRNGGITSDRWLRRRYVPKRLQGPTAVPPVLYPGSELPGAWLREPAPHEADATWCHGFDVNGQYLSAASSLSLPVGPCHLEELEPGTDITPRGRPGLWLLELPPWDRTDLPPPWRGVGPTWVTSPTAALALELGVPAPSQAWLWSDAGRLLEPWYRMLRDARAELLERPGPALEAVKAVYRRGLGRMGSEGRAQGVTDPLYQLYWSRAVVAEARTRLWRRIARHRQEDPPKITPIAIAADAVYYLSRRRRPELVALDAHLPVGTGLGQFKPAGRASAGVVCRILGNPDLTGPRTLDAIRVAVST